jgi:hypothetical protein
MRSNLKPVELLDDEELNVVTSSFFVAQTAALGALLSVLR